MKKFTKSAILANINDHHFVFLITESTLKIIVKDILETTIILFIFILCFYFNDNHDYIGYGKALFHNTFFYIIINIFFIVSVKSKPFYSNDSFEIKLECPIQTSEFKYILYVFLSYLSGTLLFYDSYVLAALYIPVLFFIMICFWVKISSEGIIQPQVEGC